MALINTIIPQQSFEVVRDRIGEIIGVELANQALLSFNYDLDPDVWVNRFVPFDKEEIPAVNITINGIGFEDHHVKQSDGTVQYNIDVYTQAKTNKDDAGDQLAMAKLHRLMGVVRAILKNPKFKTLAFAPGFIMSSTINNMAFAEPNSDDGTSTVMGRLVMSVKMPETTELINPNNIDGWDSQIKLELTDQGYKYVGGNPL